MRDFILENKSNSYSAPPCIMYITFLFPYMEDSQKNISFALAVKLDKN